MATKKGPAQNQDGAGEVETVGGDSGSERKPAGLEGIRSGLSSAYFSLEDRYYSLLDYLEDERKIPVYKKFVEPIETNSIPSFPVAALIAVMLVVALAACIAGIASLAFGPNTATVSISLVSKDGVPVSEANVTLFMGNQNGQVLGSAISDYNGMVNFGDVPLGQALWATISAPDYANYSNPLAPFSAGYTSQQLQLNALAATQSAHYSLLLRDSSNKPIPGVKVTAKTLLGAALGNGTFLSSASGSVQIPLAVRDFFIINVQKDGYTPVNNRIIDPSHSLSSTLVLSSGTSANQPKQVTAVVLTQDSQGDSVMSEVSVLTASGQPVSSKKTTDGRASFNVVKGASYTINAVAVDADAGKYFDAAGTFIASEDVNEVNLTFVEKQGNSTVTSNGSTCGTIVILTQDNASNPLAAQITLYSASGNTYLSGKTAQAGSASFDICANSTVYATAYASGYYPGQATGISIGSSATITLFNVDNQSSGSAQVTVFGADGMTPAGSATVSIYQDGMFAGYPAVVTDADGQATVPYMEIGKTYSAYAEKAPTYGWSTPFYVIDQDPVPVSVTLLPSTATIIVAPGDVVTGKPISASVTADGDGMPSSICYVDVTNSTSCELPVYAQVPVTITVSSPGYVDLTSVPITLSALDTYHYSAGMLPSRLANAFSVRLEGLYDENGNTVYSVSRGSYYDARYAVNLPKNASSYAAGLIVRASASDGTDLPATDLNAHFALMPESYSQSPAPLMSYSYNPSASCSADLQNSFDSQNYYQWASYPFSNQSGLNEVSAKVYVKPNAYTSDSLRMSDSGWYTIAGVQSPYLHIPADAGFGSANRSSSLDWCYADSDYQDYQVYSDDESCSNTACVSFGFSDAYANYSSTYSGITGRPFLANILVSPLQRLSAPHILVGSYSQLAQIGDYSLSSDSQNLSGNGQRRNGVDINLTPFVSQAQLTVNLTFRGNTDYASFFVDFYDGDTLLGSSTGYVTQHGYGTLFIDTGTQDIQVGSPTDLAVSISDYSTGEPVTDARVYLNDTTGSVFGGRSYSVLGGSVSDPTQGQDGQYWIPGVFATSKGSFQIVASEQDYLTSSKNVTVDGLDFLSLSTADIDACGEAEPLIVYNNHFLDANLSISASSGNCIIVPLYYYSNSSGSAWTNATSQIISSGSTYFVPLPSKAYGRIQVEPASWDKTCVITISGSTNDGSVSTRQVPYYNCKQNATDAFLTVFPSEVINTPYGNGCGSAANVTVYNTLSAPGGLSLSVLGPGLVLQAGGSNATLDSGESINVTRGGSAAFTVFPTRQNYTSTLSFSATDGANSANVSIPFENCPNATNDPAPIISDYSPKNYALISTSTFSVTASANRYAYCRIGDSDVDASQLPSMLNYQSNSGGAYKYGIGFDYNKGSGTPFPFDSGSNTMYIGCCNPSYQGGGCSSVVPVTFTYLSSSTPTPTQWYPTTVPSPTPVCLAAGATCNANSACCSAVCTSGQCAACNPQKPSAAGTPYKGCTSSTPVCTSSSSCVQCTDTDSSFCPSGQTCVSGKCTTQTCAAAGGTYTAQMPCCTGLTQGSDGTCVNPTACTKDSQCRTGQTCDLDQGICVSGSLTPTTAQNSRVTFDFSAQKYYVYGTTTAITGTSLDISSIMPVAGFILTLDNSMAVDNPAVFDFTEGSKNGGGTVGGFFINGTPIHGPVTVPVSSKVDILITYPDVAPDFFGGDAWGHNTGGFRQDKNGNLYFSAAPGVFTIEGSTSGGTVKLPFTITPNVIDTDPYLFGLAVFDKTYTQFLPMNPTNTAKYDPYYENPTANINPPCD